MSVAVENRPWKPKSKQKQSIPEGVEDPTTTSPPQQILSPPNDNIVLNELPPLKHPLQNRWSMWYFKNDKQKDWKSNLRFLASCDTVEDFWALFNHLKSASGLQAGCDYSFFKEGIEPMWEDPNNVKGGRWLINLNRQQRSFELDRFWQETLLCLIGESFDPFSDEICGAVVNIRPKGDKLAIWTGDAEKQEKVMKIGKNMRMSLGVPRTIPIEFQAHRDTITKSGSTTKKKYVA